MALWNGNFLGSFPLLTKIELDSYYTFSLEKQIHKKSSHCQKYPEGSSQISCSIEKKRFNESNESIPLCKTVPYYPIFGSEIHQRSCQTKDDYVRSMNQSVQHYLATYNDACEEACEAVRYHSTTLYNKVPKKKLTAYLNLKFSSMQETIYEEYLLYDLGGIVGAVGGSLGLFMGWSMRDFICSQIINRLFPN